MKRMRRRQDTRQVSPIKRLRSIAPRKKMMSPIYRRPRPMRSMSYQDNINYNDMFLLIDEMDDEQKPKSDTELQKEKLQQRLDDLKKQLASASSDEKKEIRKKIASKNAEKAVAELMSRVRSNKLAKQIPQQKTLKVIKTDTEIKNDIEKFFRTRLVNVKKQIEESELKPEKIRLRNMLPKAREELEETIDPFVTELENKKRSATESEKKPIDETLKYLEKKKKEADALIREVYDKVKDGRKRRKSKSVKRRKRSKSDGRRKSKKMSKKRSHKKRKSLRRK